MDIVSMITTAFATAKAKEVRSDAPGHLHRERSRNWVEALADQFRDAYADQAIRVFSQHHKGNRKDFLLNEPLHDIAVCRVASIPAAVHKKELMYIVDALWQIESEFAKDSHQAIVDFSKLVLGSARSKLFVGPQVTDNESFIQVLAPAAAGTSGDVFLALLPHPNSWDSSDAGPLVWHFSEGAWYSHGGQPAT
jgi:hypothetical protein